MAVTTCRKCVSKVDRKEKKCLYCNAKNPGERWWHGPAALVIFIVVLVGGLKACSYLPEIQNDSNNPTIQYKDTTLEQWRNLGKDVRLKIINSYLTQMGIPLLASNDFYKCISQHSFTKNDGIKADEALNWCKQDYQRDPTLLSKMVDFDAFKSNVRSFDSSYRPLTAAIKDDMYDSSSFKHLETKYQFVLDSTTPYAVVTSTYQGANNYGLTVKNQVSAKVDLNTGRIVEYLRDE
ncbi:hypothetical protein AAH678_15210 [Sodalis endosymbiont of Spalangia cameroni]|uniref:hypothetical protein n=1 Tax=Sodalis praecaptivus TaxID=1239307 RepID=UPI0031F849A2